MPNVEIRDVEAGDAAAIAALLGQLGYPVDMQAVRARVERMLGHESERHFVAVLEGRVVGLAGIQVSHVLEYEAPVAKLSEIVVDEGHRRRGVGEALVAAAEREARSRGCALIFLTTAERRKDAHAFYTRLGFEETGRRFAKPLA